MKKTESEKTLILAQCQEGELSLYRIAKNYNISPQLLFSWLNPEKVKSNNLNGKNRYNTAKNTEYVRKFRSKKNKLKNQ